MTLELVPHTHIGVVWPHVGPLLERSLDPKAGSGECTIDQLRMMLVEQRQHLILISNEEGKFAGALTVEFVNYPNKRIAVGTAFGGRGITNMEVMDSIKQWCKDMGAQEFRTYAKESQARLYARVGMEKVYNVVGVSL